MPTRHAALLSLLCSVLCLAAACNLQDDAASPAPANASDAADAAEASEADALPACTAPEERCDGACVDTTTSAAHCGRCGAACTPPPNADVVGCVAGDCRFACADGYFDINDDLFGDGCESECAPGAVELCGDQLDNDCDDQIDEDCECSPGDQQPCGTDQGECTAGVQECGDDGAWGPCEGQVTGVGEVCNGLDDDCDGDVDENVTSTFFADLDGDGFGDPDNTAQRCDPGGGFIANDDDCDDTTADVNPDAEEACALTGADRDCDGLSACADADCLNEACISKFGGASGFCVKPLGSPMRCVASGACVGDKDCNEGLSCRSSCCCPGLTTCLCSL